MEEDHADEHAAKESSKSCDCWDEGMCDACWVDLLRRHKKREDAVEGDMIREGVPF